MRVLVTGAAGLIGCLAVRALGEAGFDVVGLDRGPAPQIETAAGWVVADLRRPVGVAEIVRARPDTIVHAAAVLPPSFFGDAATEAARANRAIDDTVIEAARVASAAVVFLSSTSLYGSRSDEAVCREDSTLMPRGPYGDEKLRSEERVLALESGATVLRLSSPYSAAQRISTVLRKFVERAARGEDLLYFGTGAREQDFIDAEDVAAAIVKATTIRSATGIYNVASGRPMPMKALAELVVGVVGAHKSRVRSAGVDDPEESCRVRISIEKAERELGWRPAIDLEAGIRALASGLAAV